MRHTMKIIITFVVALILNTLSFNLVMAEGESPADSNSFELLDSGIDTIDVSKYPKEMQEKYLMVKAKCGQCHSLARVINSKYALSDEWKRYIKRMRRKPGSKIKKKEAKKVWEFLVYDSQQRKSELIKKKTAEAEKENKEK